MKTRIRLEDLPHIELTSATPAARALDAGLVTRPELLRLKILARLQARGLPPHIGWSDLLQEAFMRMLDGSRPRPPALPVVPFLAGVMRSIREQYWRRTRRQTRHAQKLQAAMACQSTPGHDIADPAPNPERQITAIQQLESINRLFHDDIQAREIIEGLYVGLTPEEIRAQNDMAETDYESTRKRIRRALARAGLTWDQT